MAKNASHKHTIRDGSVDCTRSIKSPPKSGSVRSAAVEKAVRKVASKRSGSGRLRNSDTRNPNHDSKNAKTKVQ